MAKSRGGTLVTRAYINNDDVSIVCARKYEMEDDVNRKRDFLSLVPRPVRAIRVTRGGLEPSAIDEFFPTSLTGGVTSEIAEDDWERRWDFLRKEACKEACGLIFVCRSEEQLI